MDTYLNTDRDEPQTLTIKNNKNIFKELNFIKSEIEAPIVYNQVK